MEGQATQARHPKFVRWALLLGIVVVLNIFFSVVLALVYPAPSYSKTDSAAACTAAAGTWTEVPPPTAADGTVQPKTNLGYCDLSVPNQQHSLHVFVVMMILGIITLLLGFVPIGSSIVSSGLSYGGVLALVVGSARYWGNAGNWLRLVISAVALAALLYIGWRRFRD